MTGRRSGNLPFIPEPGLLLHVVPNGLGAMRKVPWFDSKKSRKVGDQESDTFFLYLFVGIQNLKSLFLLFV